jgi:hypothetical protein
VFNEALSTVSCRYTLNYHVISYIILVTLGDARFEVSIACG